MCDFNKVIYFSRIYQYIRIKFSDDLDIHMKFHSQFFRFMKGYKNKGLQKINHSSQMFRMFLVQELTVSATPVTSLAESFLDFSEKLDKNCLKNLRNWYVGDWGNKILSFQIPLIESSCRLFRSRKLLSSVKTKCKS